MLLTLWKRVIILYNGHTVLLFMILYQLSITRKHFFKILKKCFHVTTCQVIFIQSHNCVLSIAEGLTYYYYSGNSLHRKAFPFTEGSILLCGWNFEHIAFIIVRKRIHFFKYLYAYQNSNKGALNFFRCIAII